MVPGRHRVTNWKDVLSSIDGPDGADASLDRLRICVERILVLSEEKKTIPVVCIQDFVNACNFLKTIKCELPQIVVDAVLRQRRRHTLLTSIRILVSSAKLALFLRRQTRCPPADDN